jgi:adenylate kinase family enzyme
MQRITVKGTSGAGKTTVARTLAGHLGLAYVELDELHHGPNWTEATAEELQAKVRAFMESAPDGWVVDGNYERKLGELVVSAADTVVWLDLPLRVALTRVTRRTIRRIRLGEELWSGNRESWRGGFFGWESMFVWTIRSHLRHRRARAGRLARHPNLRVVRLRSAREVESYLSEA